MNWPDLFKEFFPKPSTLQGTLGYFSFTKIFIASSYTWTTGTVNHSNFHLDREYIHPSQVRAKIIPSWHSTIVSFSPVFTSLHPFLGTGLGVTKVDKDT
jgi:hypothetical protein